MARRNAVRFGSAGEKLLTDHVRDRLPPLRQRASTRYDVVNEAVQPETGEIRDTNVTRALGGEPSST